MAVLVGKQAPDFTATAVYGQDFKDIKLSQFRGKNVVLFFYPLDFTFVCPTELHAFQDKLAEFQERNVEVLGCSVDSQFSHLAWLNTPKGKGGIEGVKYGLVADVGGRIASSFDVLSEGNVAFRGLFLIDKTGVVRHQVVNDLPLGRSVEEALRMVDSLIHFEKHGEVCPANWTKGDTAIKATKESVSDYLAKR
jgi:peroxiredoxin (alkyl hydroperoxide reductase subunit C)